MATHVVALAVALWGAVVAPVTIARTESPVALGVEPVRVWLKPDRDESLIARLERLGTDRRVFLVLNGLSAETAPGTAFAIHLDAAPPDTNRVEGAPTSPRVGRFSLYEEVRAGRTAAPATFRSFDVTTRLEELRVGGHLTDALIVTIVPERKTAADAKAAIASVELIAR